VTCARWLLRDGAEAVVLLEESDHAVQLRQARPFAGILPEADRHEISIRFKT
jgi:hypothetical protein